MYLALYNTTTGALISQGTIMAETLPNGMALLTLQQEPTSAEMWDASTRTFIARPAKVLVDRLQDLLDDADFAAAWASLNATQKNRLRTAMIRLLGRQRYRAAHESVEVS